MHHPKAGFDLHLIGQIRIPAADVHRGVDTSLGERCRQLAHVHVHPAAVATPGCSNGDEWRETTARRVTEKFNAPTTLKIPSNPSNPPHPRAHPTVTGHIPQLRVRPGTIRRSARAS